MFRRFSSLAACLTMAFLPLPLTFGTELTSDDAESRKSAPTHPDALGQGLDHPATRLEFTPTLEIYTPGEVKAAKARPRRLERLFAEHSGRWEVRWDARSDQPHLIQGPGILLWPTSRDRLESKDATTAPVTRMSQVERRLRRFLDDHPELFGVSSANLRLDQRRSFGSGTGLWLVELEQFHGGLPVVGARVFMRINQGRLVQFGSRGLAKIELDLEPTQTVEQAFDATSRAFSQELELLADRGLAIYPVDAGQPTAAYLGVPGQGVDHRLAWRLTAGAGEHGFDLVVDAHTGELLESRSLTRSVAQVSGQVAPVRRDQPREKVAFPWLQVANDGYRFTDDEGNYSYRGGIAMAGLQGLYVTIDDACGRSVLASEDGKLDFGDGGGDCQTPGFGGEGNTLAARTAFYYLSRAQKHADDLLAEFAAPRGGDDLLARTNLPGDGCRAFYNGAAGTIDFERSASGCANPGELPGIVLHEWGHSFAATYGGTTDGATAEAAADTFSFLETGEPCIGDGFRPGVTCLNCSRTCTGVRDLAAFAMGGDAILARPDTVTEELGMACGRLGCPYLGPGATEYQGPMGYQAHCESLIASSANWDLAQLLVEARGEKHGWQIMNELWYYSRPAAGDAYRKLPAIPQCKATQDAVDGCDARNWYTLYLAIDDDDGDLSNGTPNGCLIWQAFDAHGIACGSQPDCFCARDAVADAGPERVVCAGEPVEIGTPARPGHSYFWTSDPAPSSGDKDPAADDWAQPQLLVAPVETTSYTLEATTACDAAIDQVTVQVVPCGSPFDGDFEAGGAGWERSGLWHMVKDSTCASPGYSSEVRAMYYGQDEACDYDTDGPTSGELISPWIDGITDSSHLVFDFAREVELAPFDRDRAEVAIAVEGASGWDPRWARDAIDPSTGSWTSAGPISLAPYAGKRIQVRFRFDSRDAEANAHLGWLVDDVAVIDLEPTGGGAEPEITLLDPPAESSHPACTCVAVSAFANDLEDGDLAAIVNWSSDRDGPIGAGRSLAAALSVGTHVLSASVTDHDGQTSTKTVTVTIEPAEGCDLTDWPPASPDLFCGDDE